MPRLPHAARRRRATLALIALVVALPSCAAPDSVAPAVTPAIPAQFLGVAFLMDVDKVHRTVRITPPTTGALSPSLAPASHGTGPSLSLLGNDVITVSVANFNEGALDAVVRGKVLVTFDLVVRNQLTGIALDTPTWPTPAAGMVGVQAFPFETTVLARAGGVTSVDGGVAVALPTRGTAVPSTDWDGEPHNFFDDVPCSGANGPCFRYEPFGRIAPGGASEPRRVGFLLDPSVATFQSRIILAADLAVAPPP